MATEQTEELTVEAKRQQGCDPSLPLTPSVLDVPPWTPGTRDRTLDVLEEHEKVEAVAMDEGLRGLLTTLKQAARLEEELDCTSPAVAKDDEKDGEEEEEKEEKEEEEEEDDSEEDLLLFEKELDLLLGDLGDVGDEEMLWDDVAWQEEEERVDDEGFDELWDGDDGDEAVHMDDWVVARIEKEIPPRPPRSAVIRRVKAASSVPGDLRHVNFMDSHGNIRPIHPEAAIRYFQDFGSYRVVQIVDVKSPLLAKRFEAQYQIFKRRGVPTQCSIAFHGTAAGNIPSISRHGLLIPGEGNNLRVVHGSALGKGIYLARSPSIPVSYAPGGKMLLCLVLPGLSHTKGGCADVCTTHDSHISGEVLVLFRSAQVLPLFVVQFQSSTSGSMGGTVQPPVTLRATPPPPPPASAATPTGFTPSQGGPRLLRRRFRGKWIAPASSAEKFARRLENRAKRFGRG